MEPKDMALQVAEHILLLQSQIDARNELILTQPNAPSRKRLDSSLFVLESEIRNGEDFRSQFDEIKRVIHSQDDAAILLRSLYDSVVLGKMTA